MARKVFSRKLLQRLRKVDQEQLERVLSRLVAEKDLIDLVFETIAEGVLVTDGSRRILLANAGFRALLGLGDEALAGGRIQDIIQDPPLLSRLSTDVPGQDPEVKLDGPRETWVEVKSVPLWEEQGHLLGKLHVIRDVTEHRQKLAADYREHRLASLGALAAGLAHEIRNPLNALSIHAQLARRAVATEADTRWDRVDQELGIVGDAVKALDAIVRQFLNAARPRKLDKRARDLHVILDASLALLAPELEEKGVILEKNYDVTVPPLLIDAVQMQEVVMNLVQNAIQAMPDGGVLSVRTSQDSAGMIRVGFGDTGAGIPEEVLNRIFDPYFTTKEEGTGLGLFIVHRIITDHCGMLEVDSKVGKGTQITVLLPRSLCEAKFLPEGRPFHGEDSASAPRG